MFLNGHGIKDSLTKGTDVCKAKILKLHARSESLSVAVGTKKMPTLARRAHSLHTIIISQLVHNSSTPGSSATGASHYCENFVAALK